LSYRNSHEAICKEKFFLKVQNHATVEVTAGTNSCYSRDDGFARTLYVAAAIVWIGAIQPFLVEAVDIYWAIERASPDEVGSIKVRMRDDNGFKTTFRVNLVQVGQ
jgi:hypothetical protein